MLPEIPGWFHPENASQLERLIAKHRISTVIEIGSFLGLSAHWFAQRVNHVFCIDPFVQMDREASNCNNREFMDANGIPDDYYAIFRQNMIDRDVWYKVTPIRGLSADVVATVPPADLVYIDGDHSYAGCASDIRLYQPKAAKVICGDDFVTHKPEFGVVQAVTELLPGFQTVWPFWYHECHA